MSPATSYISNSYSLYHLYQQPHDLAIAFFQSKLQQQLILLAF